MPDGASIFRELKNLIDVCTFILFSKNIYMFNTVPFPGAKHLEVNVYISFE